MDFTPTADQQALGEAVAALVAGRLPLEALRGREEEAEALRPAELAELGQAGVFSLALPEARGGLGLGLAEAVVVFEELGRTLVPGPLVGTALAAGLVPGAAEGAVAVGVLTGGGGGPGPLVVEHLEGLGALLVLPGPTADGPAVVVDAATLDGRRLAPALDPLTPVWALADRPGGGTEVEGGATEARRLFRAGAVLTAALQVGTAAECVDRAVAYAGEREQFGRPIGAFQAVKHLCADMLVKAEVARAAVHAAACLADQPEAAAVEAGLAGTDVETALLRAAAGAKLLADEAAVGNVRTAVQVHGGMGFTWEVPLHLHLKRARLRATTFGTPTEGAATVAGSRSGAPA
jgi:alkylation response protein AidB-like acyl-CoA dehydrogenase